MMSTKRPRTLLVLTVLTALALLATTGLAFQSRIVTLRPQATTLTQPLLAAVSTSGTNKRSKKNILLGGNPTTIGLHFTRNADTTKLFASSSDDETSDKNKEGGEEENAETKLAKKVEGRKKRVGYGYRLSMVIFALLGLSTLVPAFLRPEMAAISLNYAGGPVLGAGMAFILAGAAENDRLGSDTYKRLNLMYAKFGFLWLLAGFLVRQTTPLTRGAKILSNPLVMIASFYALVNGLKGWGYGAKGWDKASSTSYGGDLIQLVKNSAKVFVSSPVLPNIKSGLYLGATVFAGVLKVLKLVDLAGLCADIGTTAVTAAKFGSWSIGFAKITLVFTAAFTLFDAAKRDRLEGSTFIELNVLSSFAWLGIGAYMFQSGQLIMASLSTFFSSFSLLSGVSSYLKKKEASK